MAVDGSSTSFMHDYMTAWLRPLVGGTWIIADACIFFCTLHDGDIPTVNYRHDGELVTTHSVNYRHDDEIYGKVTHC